MQPEADDKKILSPDQIERSVKQEREWLEENNAISAVTGGPVEDQEGVPLPADLHQGTPPAHSDAVSHSQPPNQHRK